MKGNDYCYGTFSTDSDYHTYGGNLEITEIYPKYSTHEGDRTSVWHAKIRCLESILQQSKLTFDQFRDLCILMGTDFNPNIPNVGPVKSWKAIQKYGSIVAMSQYEDVSILRYPEVVRLFHSSIIKLTMPQPIFDTNKFRENARQIFDINGLKDHTSVIFNLLPHFTSEQVVTPKQVVEQLTQQVAALEL